MAAELLRVGKEILCPVCIDDSELVYAEDVRACYVLLVIAGKPRFQLQKPEEIYQAESDHEANIFCCKCMTEFDVPKDLEALP